MTLGDWEQLSEESLVRYKVFDVVKARRRSPRTGADIGVFVFVDRTRVRGESPGTRTMDESR